MKKNIIFLFLLPLVLLSTEWSLFLYMGADNDLHHYAIQDIIEMQKGLLSVSENIQIIVYIDHAPSYKNGSVEYLLIQPSSKDHIDSRILRSLPDENSGSGETLTGFLNWAYPRYASKKNMLVLWSHGNGWMRGDDGSRWIIEDSTALSNIGIADGELHDALKKHNKKYDIMVLDACNSGTTEVMGEIYGFADYVVTSPDSMPVNGFPWELVLMDWKKGLNSIEVCELLVDMFTAAYNFGGIYNPSWITVPAVSVSVYDMGKYLDIVEYIKEFVDVYANAEYAEFFEELRNNIGGYGRLSWDIDMIGFFEAATRNGELRSPPVAAISDRHTIAANSVRHFDGGTPSVQWRSEIAATDFVVINKSLNSSYEKTISIFYPPRFEQFIGMFYNSYNTLKFVESGWARFLNYVYGDDVYPPNPVSNIAYTVNLDTIYINWEPVIDPCDVKYRVTINSQESFIVSGLSFSHKISQSGYFTIDVIDKSGNVSDDVRKDFVYMRPSDNKFYISPNPVRSSNLNINYFLTDFSAFVNIALFDISGRKVWEKKFLEHNSGEYNIQVEGLGNGIYFGVMDTNMGRITDKFAVEK